MFLESDEKCIDDSENGQANRLLLDVNGKCEQMRYVSRPSDIRPAVCGKVIEVANHDSAGAKSDFSSMGNKLEDQKQVNGHRKRNGRSKTKSYSGKDVHPEQESNYMGDIENVDLLASYVNNHIGPKKLKKCVTADCVPATSSSGMTKTGRRSKDQFRQNQCAASFQLSNDNSLTSTDTVSIISSCVSFNSFGKSGTCSGPCDVSLESNQHAIGQRSGDEVYAVKSKGLIMPDISDKDAVMGNYVSSFKLRHCAEESEEDTKLEFPGKANMAVCGNALNCVDGVTVSTVVGDQGLVVAVSDIAIGQDRGVSRDWNTRSVRLTPTHCATNPKNGITVVGCETKLCNMPSVASNRVAMVDASPGFSCLSDSKLNNAGKCPIGFLFNGSHVDTDLWSTVKKRRQRKEVLVNEADDASVVCSSCKAYCGKDILLASRAGSGVDTWTHRRCCTPPPNVIAPRPPHSGSPSDAFLLLHSDVRRHSQSCDLELYRSQLQSSPTDKDSDIESCKSLPVGKHSGNRISYAAIVSTSLLNPMSDLRNASDMDEKNPADLPDHAACLLKWKGLPHERRHSIGSAPGDAFKCNVSSTVQHGGSHEALFHDACGHHVKGGCCTAIVTVENSVADSTSGCVCVAEASSGHHPPNIGVGVCVASATTDTSDVFCAAQLCPIDRDGGGSVNACGDERKVGDSVLVDEKDTVSIGCGVPVAHSRPHAHGRHSVNGFEGCAVLATAQQTPLHTKNRWSVNKQVGSHVQRPTTSRSKSRGMQSKWATSEARSKACGVEFLDSKVDVHCDISFFYDSCEVAHHATASSTTSGNHECAGADIPAVGLESMISRDSAAFVNYCKEAGHHIQHFNGIVSAHKCDCFSICENASAPCISECMPEEDFVISYGCLANTDPKRSLSFQYVPVECVFPVLNQETHEKIIHYLLSGMILLYFYIAQFFLNMLCVSVLTNVTDSY